MAPKQVGVYLKDHIKEDKKRRLLELHFFPWALLHQDQSFIVIIEALAALARFM
jgi:hypothetical protein